MAEEYRKETENAYLDKISDICGILPKVVTRYERSIQQMTEVRTRYAYLCDIKIFLEYISEELETPIKEINAIISDTVFVPFSSSRFIVKFNFKISFIHIHFSISPSESVFYLLILQLLR